MIPPRKPCFHAWAIYCSHAWLVFQSEQVGSANTAMRRLPVSLFHSGELRTAQARPRRLLGLGASVVPQGSAESWSVRCRGLRMQRTNHGDAAQRRCIRNASQRAPGTPTQLRRGALLLPQLHQPTPPRIAWSLRSSVPARCSARNQAEMTLACSSCLDYCQLLQVGYESWVER